MVAVPGLRLRLSPGRRFCIFYLHVSRFVFQTAGLSAFVLALATCRLLLLLPLVVPPGLPPLKLPPQLLPTLLPPLPLVLPPLLLPPVDIMYSFTLL